MSQIPAEPLTGMPEALGVELGTRLRAARRRAGLTMHHLAELSGVSQSHLSQMENGKVSPSINTLYRLATSLNVTPQELLPAANQSLSVIPAGSVPPTPIADIPGAATARVLVGAPDRLLQLQEVNVEPADSLGAWFRHDGEEFIYMIEGSIELEVRGQTPVELHPGDAAWYDSSLDHKWALIGQKRARLIVASAVAMRDSVRIHSPG